jgi:DNA (cytosine-5)-methyltransferase 1
VEAEVSGFKESMRHGSLFSGIGGFDLAAEWMGWQNVFHCEWNDFGKRVLKYYWPNAISYHDITKTDFTIHKGTIDILTGGFPCQPYSAAGKRLGKEDDRHLWPEMLRAIREIQPTFVVGENVRGLTNWNGGMVFDEVQADLETQGYEVTPFLLPACAVNAPHRRDRIWFIAYSNRIGFSNGCEQYESDEQGHDKWCDTQGGHSSYSQSKGLQRTFNNAESSERIQSESSKCVNGLTPNAMLNGLHEQSTERDDTIRQDNQQSGSQRECAIEGLGDEWIAADTSNKGLQRRKVNGSIGSIRKNGNQFTTGCIPPTWQEFPTQSPICNGDDGLSSRLDGITFPKWRNESIKAGGNAIVPQVAFEIFKAIQRTL